MGRRMGNLSHQINRAIDSAFGNGGTDKHSYKAENGGGMDGKVFSISDSNNLKDLGRNIMNYFRENNIEVKNIKDIKPEHLQNFLNSKSQTCTQHTIDQYSNNISKLDKICNSFCGSNWDVKENVITPVAQKIASDLRGSGHAISREDYNKILNYAKENTSQSGDAVQLQDKLGIRVNELATIKIKEIEINKEKGTIKFDLHNTKGGKELIRIIPINGKLLELIERNSKGKVGNDRLFSINPRSINKYLSRVEEKLGLDKYSNHDIRRLIAQEKYEENLKKGMTKKESIQDVSRWLNHGNNRNYMITRSYLNIH